MLGELVKILADEPEKIEKALLKGVHLILSVIIAAFIYQQVIGDYKLIPLTDYDQLISFFLSGRVLLCLFLYFLSDYLIVPLLENVSSLLFWLLKKLDVGKFTDVEVRRFLNFLGIIKVRDDQSIPLPGKNIEILTSFVLAFQKEDTKDEVTDLKEAFIKNVWNLYLVFVVIYFTVISNGLHTFLLTTIVISILVFLFLMTYGVQLIYDYLYEKHVEIYNLLSYIKTYDLIQRILGRYLIFPVQGSKKSGLRKAQIFGIGDKEYVLFIPTPRNDTLIKKEDIEIWFNKHGMRNRILILIVPTELLDIKDDLLFMFHDSLIIVDYTDEKKLEEKLHLTLSSLKRAA